MPTTKAAPRVRATTPEAERVVALSEEPGKQDNGEAQKQKRENRPAPELVRQNAERDADGGREKGLHRSQDEHLGGAESVPLNEKGASAENIPQTAKPSENARKDIHKTLGLPGGSAVTSTTSITGFSGFLPTKTIYLLVFCRLAALAPTIKLRFLI